MYYYAIVTDNWEQCPGTWTFGPFLTRKEAQWRAEREVEAATELFTDDRELVTFEIVKR